MKEVEEELQKPNPNPNPNIMKEVEEELQKAEEHTLTCDVTMKFQDEDCIKRIEAEEERYDLLQARYLSCEAQRVHLAKSLEEKEEWLKDVSKMALDGGFAHQLLNESLKKALVDLDAKTKLLEEVEPRVAQSLLPRVEAKAYEKLEMWQEEMQMHVKTFVENAAMKQMRNIGGRHLEGTKKTAVSEWRSKCNETKLFVEKAALRVSVLNMDTLSKGIALKSIVGGLIERIDAQVSKRLKYWYFAAIGTAGNENVTTALNARIATLERATWQSEEAHKSPADQDVMAAAEAAMDQQKEMLGEQLHFLKVACATKVEQLSEAHQLSEAAIKEEHAAEIENLEEALRKQQDEAREAVTLRRLLAEHEEEKSQVEQAIRKKMKSEFKVRILEVEESVRAETKVEHDAQLRKLMNSMELKLVNLHESMSASQEEEIDARVNEQLESIKKTHTGMQAQLRTTYEEHSERSNELEKLKYDHAAAKRDLEAARNHVDVHAANHSNALEQLEQAKLQHSNDGNRLRDEVSTMKVSFKEQSLGYVKLQMELEGANELIAEQQSLLRDFEKQFKSRQNQAVRLQQSIGGMAMGDSSSSIEHQARMAAAQHSLQLAAEMKLKTNSEQMTGHVPEISGHGSPYSVSTASSPNMKGLDPQFNMIQGSPSPLIMGQNLKTVTGNDSDQELELLNAIYRRRQNC